MKTYAVLKRIFEPLDYQDVKAQAKIRGITIKELAQDCGHTYKSFHLIMTGHGDGSLIAEQLLGMGFVLREVDD